MKVVSMFAVMMVIAGLCAGCGKADLSKQESAETPGASAGNGKPEVATQSEGHSTGSGHAHGADGSHSQGGEEVKFQTQCPVKGGRTRGDYFGDYETMRIFFCSPTCSQEFDKDPVTYIKQLKEAGVTIAKVQKEGVVFDLSPPSAHRDHSGHSH